MSTKKKNPRTQTKTPLSELAQVAKDGSDEVATVVANNVATSTEQVAEVLEAQKSRAQGVVGRARVAADERVRGGWSKLRDRLDGVVNRLSAMLSPG